MIPGNNLEDDDSVLSRLYESYSESNAMYDDEIKADFHALYEAMNGMTLREMDQIVYPVCTLCRDHQKSGFMEGARVGFQLYMELMSPYHPETEKQEESLCLPHAIL